MAKMGFAWVAVAPCSAAFSSFDVYVEILLWGVGVFKWTLAHITDGVGQKWAKQAQSVQRRSRETGFLVLF